MKVDKKKSKFKLILTTFCCLVWLSCFCSAWELTITWTNSLNLNWYNWSLGSSNMFSEFVMWDFAGVDTWNIWRVYITCTFSNYTWSTYFTSIISSKNFNTTLLNYTFNVSTNLIYYQSNGVSFAWNNVVNGLTQTSSTNLLTSSSQYRKTFGFGFGVVNSSTSFDCVNNECFASYDYSCTFTWDNVNSNFSSGPSCPTIDQNYCVSNNLCPSCPTCPSQYTSLECQQEYSLIPVSSVDQNYCVSNNLCPVSEGGECSSWDVQRSALYINNVQHLGGAIIRVDIPEEISRDYEQWTGEFDLDVFWYNVNYEAIQDKIDLQNYKPSQEDFNNVIWVLAKYMPLIIILIWFVVIVAIIKNSFKSKKL